MKEKSKVELYERIRRDRRLEVASIRELARRHGVHRRTVREALETAVRRHPERAGTAIESDGDDRRFTLARLGEAVDLVLAAQGRMQDIEGWFPGMGLAPDADDTPLVQWSIEAGGDELVIEVGTDQPTGRAEDGFDTLRGLGFAAAAGPGLPVWERRLPIDDDVREQLIELAGAVFAGLGVERDAQLQVYPKEYLPG